MHFFEEYCEVHLEPTLAPHRWVFRSNEVICIRFGVALAKAPLQGEVWYKVSDGLGFSKEERLAAQTEGVRQNGYQIFSAILPTVANGCYYYRLGYRAADGCEHTSTQTRRLFVNDDAPRTMVEVGSTFLDMVDGQALYGPQPQVPITPGPQHWDHRLIYSLLTDRFARSVEDERAGLGPVTYDPSAAYHGHGGTLRGVIEKLPYLKALGVGVILLSPVYVNNSAGYHGYYLTHLLMVDPGQGTLADLRELVAKAHGLDMAVILDVICNHIGDSITWRPYREGSIGEFHYVSGQRTYQSKRGLLTTFSYVGSQDTPVLPYPEEARNPALFHGTEYTDIVRQRLFGVMEDWRTEIPAVRQLLIDHLKYWIAATDIDGFRHDAARHIEPEFWQSCIAEIARYTTYLGKTNFLHIAEHAGVSASELAEYNQARFPSLLDFPTFYTIIRSFEGENRLQGLADYVCGYLCPKEHYGVDWRANVMFLDGHDRTRIYHEFLRLLPNRGLAKICFHFALACLILGPQPPLLYYGTEQEFSGALGTYYWEEAGEWLGHDCYVREDMFLNPECRWQFGPLNYPQYPPYSTAHATFELIRRLAAIRAQYGDLLRGERRLLPTADSKLRCLLLGNAHTAQPLLIVMNFGPGPVSESALVLPHWAHGLTTLTTLVATAGGTVQQGNGYLKLYLLPGAFYVGVFSATTIEQGLAQPPGLHFAATAASERTSARNG